MFTLLESKDGFPRCFSFKVFVQDMLIQNWGGITKARLKALFFSCLLQPSRGVGDQECVSVPGPVFQKCSVDS
jgi:hypothetical protein